VRSISSRLLIGTSVFIAIFFVLLAVTISYSVHKRAEAARFDALKGVVYGILGSIDIDDNAKLTVSAGSLPDDALNRFNSKLYAEIISNDRSRLWKSNSSIRPLPQTNIRPINDWQFEKVAAQDSTELLRVQYVVAWELGNGEELPFIVHVAENVEDLSSQLRRFDRVLWFGLLAVAPIFPIVQWIMLRISLKPMRDMGQQIEQIEQGQRDSLSKEVPKELEPLTSGLNSLLGAERERHLRYRNLLGDLSHTLKTPLSVLHNMGDTNTDSGRTIREQTQLMQSSLERYAQRASTQSPIYLSPSIRLAPCIERLTRSLTKLYDSQNVQFSVEVNNEFMVRIHEADLLELLGNVLENACKYGAHRITISLEGSTLHVTDDGPGWPPGDLAHYLDRGARADTQTIGQGIGLASVHQIMTNYGGRVELSRAANGGAEVVLYFA